MATHTKSILSQCHIYLSVFRSGNFAHTRPPSSIMCETFVLQERYFKVQDVFMKTDTLTCEILTSKLDPYQSLVLQVAADSVTGIALPFQLYLDAYEKSWNTLFWCWRRWQQELNEHNTFTCPFSGLELPTTLPTFSYS